MTCDLAAYLSDASEFYEERAKKWHSRFLVSARNETSGARGDADIAAREVGHMAEIKGTLKRIEQ